MKAQRPVQGYVRNVLVILALTMTAKAATFAAEPQTPVLPSHGEYMGHKWDIGPNHLLRWDAKPYVHVGFTGNGDLARMLKAGFTQFTLAPDEKWPISGPDAKIVQSVNETSDRLEKGGATYYGSLNAFWPWRYGTLIAESDKVTVFVRSVRDVTEHAGQHWAADLHVRVPIPPAERDKVKPVRTDAMLFDLEHGTRYDLSAQVESVVETVAEPGPDTRRESEDERRGGKAFRVRLQPIDLPESTSLRLVLAMEVRLAELPGVNGLPPLWKPGIRAFYRQSLEAFRPAYAKPGLRGLQFGDEINAWPQSLLTARAYLDLRQDTVALGAYRDWLARRFGRIEELNRQLGAHYASFDQVEWRSAAAPLCPRVGPHGRGGGTGGVVGRHKTTWGFADTVEQVCTVSRVQDEFRIWLCGHWLAQYAKLAKEVIGPVPVSVCSASIGGEADQYLALHRWALREGVDGLIRNHYGNGGQEECHALASLTRWMDKVQQESGHTKHLWANEVGYVRPHDTDEEWAAREAAERGAGDSFGSQWAFPSRESLCEMLRLLSRYGYRGFNRFLMNPSAPRAAQEVEWMAELRPEITSAVAQADEPPGTVERLTREQAIAAARADGRVPATTARRGNGPGHRAILPRWNVWLVRFFAGDGPLGFVSVSWQAEVLEVGGPNEPQREGGESRENDKADPRLTYHFSKAARIHVPEAANTAALVTSDRVVKEPYQQRLRYQFVLVEDQGHLTLISHRSAVPNDPFPSVSIGAGDDSLVVTLQTVKPDAVQSASFATMGEAIADYQRWLERTYRIGRIGEHPNKPSWLGELRQVFTIDLWRPQGEITQGFGDVVRFLDELHQAGATKGVLLYLCGWSGPYDARYPEYQPAAELGGVEGFRRLVETAHRYGCRVMIHTCPVAFDPWLPSFARFEDCALRGKDHPGGYRGWPGGYQSRELDFDSGQRMADGDKVALQEAPRCEACVTVGGFGMAPLQVTVGERTLGIPAGASDPYTLPFTFFLSGDSCIRFSPRPQDCGAACMGPASLFTCGPILLWPWIPNRPSARLFHRQGCGGCQRVPVGRGASGCPSDRGQHVGLPAAVRAGGGSLARRGFVC